MSFRSDDVDIERLSFTDSLPPKDTLDLLQVQELCLSFARPQDFHPDPDSERHVFHLKSRLWSSIHSHKSASIVFDGKLYMSVEPIVSGNREEGHTFANLRCW